MAELLILLTLCLGAGLLPPFRWGARLGGLILILLAMSLLVTPVPVDRGMFDEMMRASLQLFTATLLAGVALRGLIWLIRRPSPPAQRQAAILTRTMHCCRLHQVSCWAAWCSGGWLSCCNGRLGGWRST